MADGGEHVFGGDGVGVEVGSVFVTAAVEQAAADAARKADWQAPKSSRPCAAFSLGVLPNSLSPISYHGDFRGTTWKSRTLSWLVSERNSIWETALSSYGRFSLKRIWLLTASSMPSFVMRQRSLYQVPGFKG
jgi:hypothetical protein